MRPAQKVVLVGAIILFLVGSGALGAWVGVRRGGSESGSSSTLWPPPAPSAPTAAPSSSARVQTRPAQPGAQRPTAPGLARFYHQRIAWSACHDTYQCATLTVPLDYRHPSGRTLQLELEMLPARDQSTKVGPLLINPGGPGGSATDELSQTQWSSRLRDAFDIVALNPRGTTGSSPVTCLTDAQTDSWVAESQDPDTPAEVATFEHWNQQLGDGCDSALDAHVSTVEAARDMDVLRSALGKSKLDYLGFSYGTKLGATYADLFPHRVGRFVLDGAMDLRLSARQTALQQATGFQTALRSYVQHCVDGGNCFLGDTVDAGLTRIKEFVAQVDAHPLSTSLGRTLYSGNAMYGILVTLYSRDSWTYLDKGLQQAFDGDGTTLLLLSDAMAGRGLSGGYSSNILQANYVINCLDDPWSIPISKVPGQLPAFERASPTFGASWAWLASVCDDFKPRATEQPPPIGARGAPPIVVVGTTRDPATPYRWAKALASELDSGVLVSRNGDGHTGYNTGNSCVNNAVEGYLVDGKVPANGLRC